MAAEIRIDQSLEKKEPMFACVIGHKFEKNSTFYDGSHNYILVQDGEYIGATTHCGWKNGKRAKLNKRHFPYLKCGLFSKNIDVTVIAIRDGHGQFNLSNEKKGKQIRAEVKTASSDKSVIVAITPSLNFKFMNSSECVYENFIVKPGIQYFIPMSAFENYLFELANIVLGKVVQNLSAEPTESFRIARKDDLKDPVKNEVFTKFKAAYEKMMLDRGYSTSVFLWE